MSKIIRLKIMAAAVLFFMIAAPIMPLAQAPQIITKTPDPLKQITIKPLPPEFTIRPKTDLTILPTTPSAFAAVTPQIDGSISSGYNYEGTEVPGEWDDAYQIDFELKYTDNSETHDATLYIKNDYINLYMALVVRDEDFTQNDLVHFNFDNDNDGVIEAGDDQWALFGPSNLYRDLYQTATDDGSNWDPLAQQDGIGYAKWYGPKTLLEPIYTVKPVSFVELQPNLTLLKQIPNLLSAEKAAQFTLKPIQPIITSFQPIVTKLPTTVIPKLQPPLTFTPILPDETEEGTWVFEVAHPLNSDDNAHDLNAQIGNTIGFSAAYWDGEGGAGGFPSFFNWADMRAYKIAGPLFTDPVADFSITRIEVSQAVQDTSNSLPLARRKTTVARVFLDTGVNAGTVPANVFLYARDPDTLSTLPGPLMASVNAPVNPQRSYISNTANFLLPNSWVDRNHLELLAFVTSSRTESDFNNNWLDPTVQLTFHNMRVLNVYEIPFNTGTAASPNLVSDDLITANEEAMLSTYPVDEINFVRMDWTAAGGPFNGNYDQRIAKLNEIVGQLILGWLLVYVFTGEEPDFPLPDQIYGYHTSGGGISDPTWYAASPGLGIAATGYIGTSQELTMAHEVNHNLDTRAPGSASWGYHVPPPNCGAGAGDPDWDALYPNDDDIHEFGLDTSVWPASVIPTNKPDFMSYCQTSGGPYVKWVSDYRWGKLFEHLEQSSLYPNAATAKFAGSQDPILIRKIAEKTQALQISGWIQQDPLGGGLDSILLVDSPTAEVLSEQLIQYPWLKPLVGDVAIIQLTEAKPQEKSVIYELVALDARGNELRSLTYNAAFEDVHGNLRDRVQFTRYMRMDEELKEQGAMIQLKVNGEIVGEKVMSANTPVVRVSSPQTGDVWTTRESAMIEWAGSDPDGDRLLYTVQYSPDGVLWIPIAAGTTETSLKVDPSRIPGSARGSAVVRVLATDGFNTGVGMSGLFTVSKKAPKVTIRSPAMGATFGTRDIIPLKGVGYDPEDGKLPDSAFVWDFEGGFLGTGPSIDVVRLGPGEHVISLTGTDSDGMTSMDRVQIMIVREEIVPIMLAEPLIRAGAGLTMRADVSPTEVGIGDNAVLYVAIKNEAKATATEVALLVTLPRELNLVSGESIPILFKEIPSGEMVELKMQLAGKDPGLYRIGLEATATAFAPALGMVYLGIGQEAPLIKPDEPLVTRTIDEPKTTTTDEPKTTQTTDEPKTTQTDEPKTTTTDEPKTTDPDSTTTEGGPTPGFELLPALLGIPFFLLFRRRRKRRG